MAKCSYEGILHCHAVFHAFALFGGLAIIETVKCADEITGDAANALKGYLLQMVGKIDEVAIYANVDAVEARAVQFTATDNISSDLLIGQLAFQYGNGAIIYNHG